MPVRLGAIRRQSLHAAPHAPFEVFPFGPEQHASAEHGRHLTEPDEQEKFPEQTPHAIP
jgi:hypothetical protein